MYKIEELKLSENGCIKYTHFFSKGHYDHTEKMDTQDNELGLKVVIQRLPNTVEKWSCSFLMYVGTIIKIYFLYENESLPPIKKYLIRFNHGDFICDAYKEVYKDDIK